MNNDLQTLLITDFLFIVIVIGWIVLIVAGIEPDKPLSGGIPGHVDLSHLESHHEGRFGRLGEPLAWTLFAAVSLSLPLILWWVFHAQAPG